MEVNALIAKLNDELLVLLDSAEESKVIVDKYRHLWESEKRYYDSRLYEAKRIRGVLDYLEIRRANEGTKAEAERE